MDVDDWRWRRGLGAAGGQGSRTGLRPGLTGLVILHQERKKAHCLVSLLTDTSMETYLKSRAPGRLIMLWCKMQIIKYWNLSPNYFSSYIFVPELSGAVAVQCILGHGASVVLALPSPPPAHLPSWTHEMQSFPGIWDLVQEWEQLLFSFDSTYKPGELDLVMPDRYTFPSHVFIEGLCL